MQERKVVLTWEAIYDIADAEIWIYDNFGEMQQLKYKERIKKELEQKTIFYSNYILCDYWRCGACIENS